MKTIKNVILACALALPLSAMAADGDSLSTKASDTVITAKVKAKLAEDKQVKANDIKVETDSDGLVELSGTVHSKEEARKAVKLAKSVKGVTSVKDELKVAD